MRPQTTRKFALVKIAPGHGAKHWSQCLSEGYICVGWDEVGDLRKYESESAFRAVFEKHFKYDGNRSASRRKANELWTLRKLRPGDIVLANKGMSKVLAVGIVQEPGYQWQPNKDRGEYFHTVRVAWDTSLAKTIPQQPWRQTVTEIPYGLFRTIFGAGAPRQNLVRSLRDARPYGGAPNRSQSRFELRAETSAGKEASSEIERIAGFQSDQKVRKVIERYAMDLATAFFKKSGYGVEDVSSRRPYDLLCTKGLKVKYVEVKGTQECGQAVVLTAGEVAFIRRNRPNCVLCVVHDIRVNNRRRPRAAGGRISIDKPFDLSAGHLSPINFFYYRPK